MNYKTIALIFLTISLPAKAGKFYSFLGYGGTYSRVNVENVYDSETEAISDFDPSYSLKFQYEESTYITELSYQDNSFLIKPTDGLSIEDEKAVNTELSLDIFLRKAVLINFGIQKLQRAAVELYSAEILNNTQDITTFSTGAYVDSLAEGIGRLKVGIKINAALSASEEVKKYFGLKGHLQIYIPYKKVILGLDTSINKETMSLEFFEQEAFYTNIQFTIGY